MLTDDVIWGLVYFFFATNKLVFSFSKSILSFIYLLQLSIWVLVKSFFQVLINIYSFFCFHSFFAFLIKVILFIFPFALEL